MRQKGRDSLVHADVVRYARATACFYIRRGITRPDFERSELLRRGRQVLDQRQDAKMILKVAGKNKLYAKARMDPSQRVFVVTGQTRPGREGR